MKLFLGQTFFGGIKSFYGLARDCEPVFQLIQHISHGGNGEGKLPKFHYKFAFEFFEGVSSHLAPATGRKVALLAPSQDESAI